MYDRHNATWGWLLVLFALIVCLQALKQETAKPVVVQTTPTAAVPTVLARTVSAPLNLPKDCQYNVELVKQQFLTVTISPGHVWSFNDTVGDPVKPWSKCFGTDGGGLCNFAAAYARVADELGLKIQFEDHGVGDLGQGYQYSVAIWTVGNRADPAEQDLVITNTSPHTIRFIYENDRVTGLLYDE